MKLSYCDYIAYKLRETLMTESKRLAACSHDGVGLTDISSASWDLSPEGAYLSSKKTIHVSDHNGTRYRVTVEECK
jgi:hypothetical protein